jgi:hypothetical protein
MVRTAWNTDRNTGYLRKETNATVNKRIGLDAIYCRTPPVCNRFVCE